MPSSASLPGTARASTGVSAAVRAAASLAAAVAPLVRAVPAVALGVTLVALGGCGNRGELYLASDETSALERDVRRIDEPLPAARPDVDVTTPADTANARPPVPDEGGTADALEAADGGPTNGEPVDEKPTEGVTTGEGAASEAATDGAEREEDENEKGITPRRRGADERDPAGEAGEAGGAGER